MRRARKRNVAPRRESVSLARMRMPRFALAAAFAVFSAVVFAQVPLDERPAKPDEWGYRPADGATVRLNPPTFAWIAPANAATYDVQWSGKREFPEKGTTTVAGVVWPTYTHRSAVPAGTYFWRYRCTDRSGAVST